MEACGKNPTEKGVIHKGKKFYRPLSPSTYKETELLEYFSESMQWVFRDYVTSLKQVKDLLPPRNDVVEFGV